MSEVIAEITAPNLPTVERKLATVRKIAELRPIKGADRIELAVVDGWQVVTQKGIYNEGDLCIYLEIDSWVPSTVAPFLTKEGHFPRTYQGVEGERLKTIKLRGQISQGLLLQPSAVPDVQLTEGMDVTEDLGILKWERPLPQGSTGGQQTALGHFPSDIRKTDQERIQNCQRILEGHDRWETTIKMDGSSLTAYVDKDGVFNVCSRNLRLKEPVAPLLWRVSKSLGLEGHIQRWVRKFNLGRQAQKFGLTAPDQNNFWATARKFKLEEAIRSLNASTGHRVAFQGEMCGPSIQSNKDAFDDLEFFLFDIWDIDDQAYWSPTDRQHAASSLGIQHAPILEDLVTPTTLATILKMATGPSVNSDLREGLVFKSHTRPGVSFKSISNDFLLKHGDA